MSHKPGCRIIGIKGEGRDTVVTVLFASGGIYMYNNTNATEEQLKTMVEWDKPEGFTRWLGSEGIVRNAIKVVDEPINTNADVVLDGVLILNTALWN